MGVTVTVADLPVAMAPSMLLRHTIFEESSLPSSLS